MNKQTDNPSKIHKKSLILQEILIRIFSPKMKQDRV